MGLQLPHTCVMYDMMFITMLTLHVPSNPSLVQTFLARHSDSGFSNHVRNSLVARVTYSPHLHPQVLIDVLGVEVEVRLSSLNLLTVVLWRRPRIVELLINAIGIGMW